MKPQFKTLSQQCSGYIWPIPGRNVKSNKRGFSFMKLLHFGFKAAAWEWGAPCCGNSTFPFVWTLRNHQQILFVAVFSKQPLEILFATLILGWKAVRGGAFQPGGQSCVSATECFLYKERESGAREAVNFLRTNIGNVKNVNSVLRREIRVFDKSKSIFDSVGLEYLCIAFLWLWGLSGLAIVNISSEEFVWEYRWPKRKYWFGAVAPVAGTSSPVFM